MTPHTLESQCEWTADQVTDEDLWTERFTPRELDEIDTAVRHASPKAGDLLDGCSFA